VRATRAASSVRYEDQSHGERNQVEHNRSRRWLYEGLAGFRYALRQFLAFSEAVTCTAGVTAQQYQALLVIKTGAGSAIMIRELAEQMLLQHNGAVQLVDRLAAANLVRREQSLADRRSVLVALTPKGSDLLEDLATRHLEELLKQEPLLAESLKRLRCITT
jgi:DNA-binding MarR family transcriptional regulator